MIPTCEVCGRELVDDEIEVGVCNRDQEPDEDWGSDR